MECIQVAALWHPRSSFEVEESVCACVLEFHFGTDRLHLPHLLDTLPGAPAQAHPVEAAVQLCQLIQTIASVMHTFLHSLSYPTFVP